jgi:hypothetical protein
MTKTLLKRAFPWNLLTTTLGLSCGQRKWCLTARLKNDSKSTGILLSVLEVMEEFSRYYYISFEYRRSGIDFEIGD